MRLLELLKFKSKDGAVEGELGVIPETDEKNDKGYDQIIPEGSSIRISKLTKDESIAMLKNGIDNLESMY